MNKDLFVSKTIQIVSPVEVVWGVLTQSDFVKQYLYGADLITDWRVGNPVVFRGEFGGQAWEDKGTVLTSEPPTRLAYSYYSGTCGLEDRPENYATVTYELRTEGSGTVLAVRQQGYLNEDSQQSSTAGWDSVIKQIKLLAEAEK